MRLARLLPITRGLFALISQEHFLRASCWSWSACPTTTVRKNHYARARVDGRLVSLHRFLLEPAAHQEVDHLDGDGLNCTWPNLRACTRVENMQNVRRDGQTAALSVGYLPSNVIGYLGELRDLVAFPAGAVVPACPNVTYVLNEGGADVPAGPVLRWATPASKRGDPYIPDLEKARARWDALYAAQQARPELTL